MGAGVPIWVEVEVPTRKWIKSFGVVPEEAILNTQFKGYVITGNISYTDPEDIPYEPEAPEVGRTGPRPEGY